MASSVDASLGNEGFAELINTFTNSDIPITELHLAGNQLTCNQIIFLIHQVRVPYRQSNPDFHNSVFPQLRLLDLNGARPSSHSRGRQFVGERGRAPALHAVTLQLLSRPPANLPPEWVLITPFTLDNGLTTEVTSSLINVTLHEKNAVNVVIPETQLALLLEEDRAALLKLYHRIDKNSAVFVDLDRRHGRFLSPQTRLRYSSCSCTCSPSAPHWSTAWSASPSRTC